MSLESKVALVTGAGGMHGIGRAIAVGLAQTGADIAITDIRRAPEDLPEEETEAGWKSLESVAAEIEQLGRSCVAMYEDITRETEVVRFIDRTVSRLGGLHIMVNNARAFIGKDRVPVVELESEEWDRVMSVNLRGTYLCCKYAARQMIEQGGDGRIINLSSLAGKRGSPRMSAYCASKFGIIGLTQSLAQELAPHGITVNAICPGPVDTHRVSHGDRETAMKEGKTIDEVRNQIIIERAKKIPLGRVATPEDVAVVAGFLASSRAGYFTGQSINVTGGAFMD